MTVRYEKSIRMIPLKCIRVLNPRDRGKKKFGEIMGSIAKLGLKKPVIVTPAEVGNGVPHYDLVCGQGRMEAYSLLKQDEIPAIVVKGARDDLLLMGLAENLARRKHSAVELVREIRGMKDRGNSN